MRRWTLAAAASALLGAALWHLPATAQRTAPPDNPESVAARSAPAEPAPAPPAAARPIAPELITFDEYRDFRMRDIAQREDRLAHELASPGLSAPTKVNLEGRKAYYDRLAAMPADQRNQLFRARFDQIDTNHDGMLDNAERAAWREKQREHYRDLASARSGVNADQH
jgi:hypothetical protein